jgi:RNA polymerase sigma factor (sigma-70 family)
MQEDRDTEQPSLLVERLRAGEEAAWRDYLRAYGRLIYAAGRRVGLDPSDLDEAFQLTSVAAYRSIGQLRDPSKLASWTYSIARRTALKVKLRYRSEVSVEDLSDGGVLDRLASDEPSPEEIAIQWEHAGILREALAAVGDRCRRLVDLLYLQTPQPSYEEISERLHMPVGSIGPTRARCLEKLKRALGDVSRHGVRETEG